MNEPIGARREKKRDARRTTTGHHFFAAAEGPLARHPRIRPPAPRRYPLLVNPLVPHTVFSVLILRHPPDIASILLALATLFSVIPGVVYRIL
jgi:hypothetical protein